ncbi:iron transporter [Magnetospirillum moscoviense]|uniref:iron transporter n=1 Tax=Magnetospirillum moscoviense TaxID=1437059 RepID=UPI000AD86F17|nr:iron transporter [Magnetospirillum moscoviense]MBF0324120.1 iron transporter [Alphaproteobacteria bacterium]
MKTMTALAVPAALACALALSVPALAGEQPIGEPVEKNGMAIAGVYLQAVTMEPAHAHHAQTDIHLEADIKAIKGNNNGFGEGEWVPYLEVEYELTKKGGAFKRTGKLVPMVASDGPHYGDNVKMDGAGKYHVVYRIAPGAHGFLRHTDKETGVRTAILREKGFADLRKAITRAAPGPERAAIILALRAGLMDDAARLDAQGVPPDVFAVNQ